MSTGDLRNNLYKLQSKLKKIEFHGYLNCISLGKGDPESFLPLFHFILLDAYPLLADYFASKGYNLYGKKDAKFIECVYKLLRDEFTYKPTITKEQFFSLGFSERKIILTCDIIDMCMELNKKLIRVEYNKGFTTKRSQNINMRKKNRTRIHHPENYYEYDDNENFHNPINILNNHSSNQRKDFYSDDDDELSISQQKLYQNELDGVMQYPPSRFLKPSWSGEKIHDKVEDNNPINDESNYYEDSYNNNYINTKTNDEYKNDNKSNHAYNVNNNTNDNDTSISNVELISYIKLLLDSNNEIKKSIDSLSERLTKLELKVENSSTYNKNQSTTENNIMKIKNIIEKEKSISEENNNIDSISNLNTNLEDSNITNKDTLFNDNSMTNNEISLIQEQCVAEEVSIDESVSSKPNISVQRSSYSQNRYNGSLSELNNSNIKSPVDNYSKFKDSNRIINTEFRSNVDSCGHSENRNSSNRNSQEFYNNKSKGQSSNNLFNSNQNISEDNLLKNKFSLPNNNQVNEKDTLDYLEKVTQNLQETKNIFMGNVLT